MTTRIIIFVFASIFLLSGCTEIDCGGLEGIVLNEKNNTEIVAWAEDNFFSHEIPGDQLASGGFVGPGRRKIASALAPATPTTSFSEIRLIGKNAALPDAIFLAKGAYRGVLVSRHDDVEDILKSEGIISEEIHARSQRLAAICRPRS